MTPPISRELLQDWLEQQMNEAEKTAFRCEKGKQEALKEAEMYDRCVQQAQSRIAYIQMSMRMFGIGMPQAATPIGVNGKHHSNGQGGAV